MNTHHCSHHVTGISVSGIFLTVFYLAGLLCGILLASPLDAVRSVFIFAFVTKPIIPFLFLTIVAPTAICVLILRTRLLVLSYPFLFLWSLCRGFCGMMIFYVIGEGAWLVRCVFLLSSNCLSVLLWWMFIRHFNSLRQSFFSDTILVSFLSLAVFVFDLFFVPGFLSLFSTYF